MRNYKSYRRSHCVGWSEFHLQWCTKYRYKLFKNNLYKNICAIFLVECSKRYNFKFQEFEIDIDHVHVTVSLLLVMSPSQVVMCLKGFSSKCMFLQFPELRKVYKTGGLWGKGKFVGSVGHITLDVAKRYVEKHREKQ